MWKGKNPETLKIQNGEYYDILLIRWEFGLSAGNLAFELYMNNNNTYWKKKDTRLNEAKKRVDIAGKTNICWTNILNNKTIVE